MSESQNPLTEEPVPKLLKELAIPMSVGFLFHTLFNIIDTFYSGQISTTALAALSLSFPVFFFIIAVGAGLGRGACALMSFHLGQGNTTQVKFLAAQVVLLSIFCGLLVSVIGLTLQGPVFGMLGAKGDYLSLALDYMTPIFIFSPIFIVGYAFNAILNSYGDMVSFRNFLITGAICNLFLDPLFMFGFGSFKGYGLAGASYSTILIEIIGTIYMGLKVVQKCFLFDREFFEKMRPRAEAISSILSQAVPAMLDLLTVQLGAFVVLYFVGWYGEEAVAAFGISIRIEQVALLPLIGIGYGVLTLTGQNFGAGNYLRIKEAIISGFKLSLVIMLPLLSLVLIFRSELAGIFTDSSTVIQVSSDFLLWSSIAAFAYMVLFITVSVFQGIQMPKTALVIGLFRQMLLPVIVFPLFAMSFGFELSGIWAGLAFVNYACGLASLWLLYITLSSKLISSVVTDEYTK